MGHRWESGTDRRNQWVNEWIVETKDHLAAAAVLSTKFGSRGSDRRRRNVHYSDPPYALWSKCARSHGTAVFPRTENGSKLNPEPTVTHLYFSMHSNRRVYFHRESVQNCTKKTAFRCLCWLLCVRCLTPFASDLILSLYVMFTVFLFVCTDVFYRIFYFFL